MKSIYLILAIIGFILPNIFALKVTFETGNILFYTDIPTTFAQMFANDIATAFGIDLLFTVGVFLYWSYQESRKHQIKNVGLVWILTFLFGLAGGFPLFLYWREKAKN